ncbi:hypothetical protein, partial [Listeria monocytogenes]
ERVEDKWNIGVTQHLVGEEKMERVLFLEEGKTLMEGHHAEVMEEEPS